MFNFISFHNYRDYYNNSNKKPILPPILEDNHTQTEAIIVKTDKLENLDISGFPFMFPTVIYFNRTFKYFHNYRAVSDEDYPKYFNHRYWSEIGMHASWNGSITNYIVSIIPEDVALIGYCADYHHDLPDSLINHFNGKIFQITRYNGLKKSIVIPGDDIFFDNPSHYLPKNPMPFGERINKVFWRGACSWNGRARIVSALKDNNNCDVKLIKHRCHEEFIREYNMTEDCFTERVTSDHYSNYKIWLSIEGWGCATDTTRALMSGCAVIYFRRTSPWFNKYLKHEENCIIIEDDISKLLFYVEKMTSDTNFTKNIAFNGKKTADIIFQPYFYKNDILSQLLQ